MKRLFISALLVAIVPFALTHELGLYPVAFLISLFWLPIAVYHYIKIYLKYRKMKFTYTLQLLKDKLEELENNIDLCQRLVNNADDLNFDNHVIVLDGLKAEKAEYIQLKNMLGMVEKVVLPIKKAQKINKKLAFEQRIYVGISDNLNNANEIN